MRHSSISCDWCDAAITAHFLILRREHIGAFRTHEHARYAWDFCGWDCMVEWNAHEGTSKRVVDGFARQFVDFSDEDLRESSRVGASRELIRRKRAMRSP